MDTNSHGTIIYPRTKIRTYINLQEYKFVFVGNEFVTELYVVFCFFFLYFLFLLILLFLSFLLYLIVSAFFFFFILVVVIKFSLLTSALRHVGERKITKLLNYAYVCICIQAIII